MTDRSGRLFRRFVSSLWAVLVVYSCCSTTSPSSPSHVARAFSPISTALKRLNSGLHHNYHQRRRQQQQQQHGRPTNHHRHLPCDLLRRRYMFTGIVEEMGTIVSIEERSDVKQWDGSVGSGTEMVVRGDVVMDGAYLGCSICVSGVCLTATALNADRKEFTVGLAPETLRRTYFGSAHGDGENGPRSKYACKAGDAVNLERASEIGGRNSGHFVQGHVDGTGTILEIWKDGDSLFFKIGVDDNPELLRYVVPKGFVAVDGTSLTVVDVNNDDEESWFTFMLVEYTQKKIILPGKSAGERVNIEVDVLGKYSENALAALVPRIEALEATVESLQKQVAFVGGKAMRRK